MGFYMSPPAAPDEAGGRQLHGFADHRPAERVLALITAHSILQQPVRCFVASDCSACLQALGAHALSAEPLSYSQQFNDESGSALQRLNAPRGDGHSEDCSAC